MRILLDTHIALWAVIKPDELTEEARDILLSKENEIYYSVISIWEVSLKHSINPKNMEITPHEFRRLCQESGFFEVSVDYQHILGLDDLIQRENSAVHKDPFDRILISQALVENMFFLTHDRKLDTFETNSILLV